MIHIDTGKIYYYLSGFDGYAESDRGYQAIDGGYFKQINVGNWELFGVTEYNEVYHRTNYHADNFMGDDWERVPGHMAMVSTAEEGIAWGLD